MDGAQVAFEQISGYPYRVKIGDGGDSVCGLERSLHFAAGGIYVQNGATDRSRNLCCVASAIFREAEFVHPLSCAFLFGVRGGANGSQFLEVGLRHYFVRNHHLAAIESTVGAQNFDSRFVEVGAGLRYVSALKLRDGLAFAHLLPRGQRKIHQPSTERRVDMDQMCRVSFNAPGYFEGARCTLHMNRLDLEVDFGLFGLNRRNVVPTAREEEYGGADEKCGDALRMNICHGLISVCAA
jgi:hypothetical protein